MLRSEKRVGHLWEKYFSRRRACLSNEETWQTGKKVNKIHVLRIRFRFFLFIRFCFRVCTHLKTGLTQVHAVLTRHFSSSEWNTLSFPKGICYRRIIYIKQEITHACAENYNTIRGRKQNSMLTAYLAKRAFARVRFGNETVGNYIQFTTSPSSLLITSSFLCFNVELARRTQFLSQLFPETLRQALKTLVLSQHKFHLLRLRASLKQESFYENLQSFSTANSPSTFKRQNWRGNYKMCSFGCHLETSSKILFDLCSSSFL